MHLRRHLARTTLLAALGAGFVGQVALAGNANAVTVAKAQLTGGRLRVEGTTQRGNPMVEVLSTTSDSFTRPDGNGRWVDQASNFTAPDCFLTVKDFASPIQTIKIAGCTPSVKPVGNPAPPTGRCVITPQPNPTTLTLGADSVFWFHATGCDPSTPLSYDFVAGAIPTGMRVGTFQNSTSGNLIGTPSVRGTYRFTIQVTDEAGATDQENFTINVV